MSEKESKQKKRTPKQIAALVGVIVLVAMYLITLVVACLDFEGSGRLFQACIVLTIALPILIWIYIWMYGVLTQKKTTASFNLLDEDEAEKE